MGSCNIRQLLPVFAIWWLFFLAGCDFGTRYIFASGQHPRGSAPEKFNFSYEEIWFPAVDGVQLYGWFVPPRTSRTARAVVVFFHGNATDIPSRVQDISHLHRLGHPVFIFNYRGYGASEGRALKEEDLYRDGRGALKWLRGSGWDHERMIFYGHSLGAAVALQMALEYPPAGVVLANPFSSLPDIARETTPLLWRLLGWWSTEAAFDNIGKVPLLTCPLLIVHGEQDEIVPVRMSLSLFEAAADPKFLYIVQNGGHSDTFETGGNSFRTVLRNFLANL
jgi:uncharacterized protein